MRIVSIKQTYLQFAVLLQKIILLYILRLYAVDTFILSESSLIEILRLASFKNRSNKS